MISIKRIYETYDVKDGFRILVDRLWPRGISKEKAHIDLWLKEIAPRNVLRRWYHHESQNWEEFKRKYRIELEGKEYLLHQVKQLEKDHKKITLLYGAKDTKHNQAIILTEMLKLVA